MKKQGVIPLTFVNESDYDLVKACDYVRTEGLLNVLKSGGQGEVELVFTDGKGVAEKEIRVKTRHTFSKDQCSFVLAGSALNVLARKGREAKEEVLQTAELSQ